jgi:hypothetical protein
MKCCESQSWSIKVKITVIFVTRWQHKSWLCLNHFCVTKIEKKIVMARQFFKVEKKEKIGAELG